MMRIAQVVATFPPYQGGTGNVCFHNARELARRGHEVHVFTAAQPGAPRRELLDGIVVHRLRPIVRAGNAPVLPGLTWALRGFDVIHLHFPFFGGEFAALAARAFSSPLVITYQHDVLLGGVSGLLERVLRHTTMRWSLRSAARVLFSSLDYGYASQVRPLLRGRNERIGELPNGVDTAFFSPGTPRADLRAQHGLQPDNQVVLMVAGLDRAHYFKGVPTLLQALAALPNNVHGVIVGDGDLRPTYGAAAATLGLTARVKFAGRVTNTELLDYYRLADITVLPSVTMGEAFGLVLVESLACGTPVIATDLPGVRTVVDDGRDGKLVAPGDSLALAHVLAGILNDGPLRREMGQYGRAKVEARYDWSRLGAELDRLYCQVVGGDVLPIVAADVVRGSD